MTKPLNVDKELKEIGKMIYKQYEIFVKDRNYIKKPNKSPGTEKYNN